MNRAACAWLAFAAVCGCAGTNQDATTNEQASAREVAGLNSAIINGATDTTTPEIGQFWGPKGPCTATLIRPHAILAAAHCFNYQTQLNESAAGYVFMYDNFSRARAIRRWVSLTANEDSSLDDVAVAEIVPGSDDGAVAPRANATNFPTDDNAVISILGYGCGDFTINAEGTPVCTAQSDYSVKRRFNVYWWGLANGLTLTNQETGQLTLTVSGDSGGPLIQPDGSIIAVTSGTEWVNDDAGHAISSTTFFGNVPSHRSQIESALASMGVD